MKGMVEGMEYRQLTLETQGSVVVATIVPKKILENTLIQALGHELFSLTEAASPRIVLDFTSVEYIASAFLAKLMEMDRKVNDATGKWMICCVRPEVFEVFQITQLDKMLPFVATRADTVNALA